MRIGVLLAKEALRSNGVFVIQEVPEEQQPRTVDLRKSDKEIAARISANEAMSQRSMQNAAMSQRSTWNI